METKECNKRDNSRTVEFLECSLNQAQLRIEELQNDLTNKNLILLHMLEVSRTNPERVIDLLNLANERSGNNLM